MTISIAVRVAVVAAVMVAAVLAAAVGFSPGPVNDRPHPFWDAPVGEG